MHFGLLSRIVQRLHMPSLLYWSFGTSAYLHSSSSTPSDLWSQSHYYISFTCMPVKILYPCLLVDADLAFNFCSSDCFWCSCPRTCQGVLPKHALLNGKSGIIHLRYLTRWQRAYDSLFDTFKNFMLSFAPCLSRPTSVCLHLNVNMCRISGVFMFSYRMGL